MLNNVAVKSFIHSDSQYQFICWADESFCSDLVRMTMN